MKKLLIWFAAIFLLTSMEYVDYLNFRSIVALKQENRVLMTNNVNLLRVNEALSEGVGAIADKLIEKSEWDKKVADKIRQLDGDVKDIYARTNQAVPPTVQ